MAIDLDTMRSSNDVASAFRGAPNPANAIGSAIRAAVVSPVSYGMEKVADSVAPIGGAIGDFATGLVGGSSTPTPTAAPRAPGSNLPTVVGPTDPRAFDNRTIIRGSSPALPMPAVTPAAAVTAAPAPAPMASLALPSASRASRGPISVTVAPDEVNPSMRRDAPDVNQQISDLYNNGTWSGMSNAKMLAKRVDADRANAVATSSADTARIGAQTGQLSAITNALRARTDASKSAMEEGLLGENIQSAAQQRAAGAMKLEGDREEAALRKAAGAGDEKAIAKLRNLSAARQGKDPGEAVNEKLLDAYIKSTAEFNKDPSNMGKAAPAFTDFIGGLPQGMFPTVGQFASPMPAGMKRQVGTQNGKPVYEDAKGNRHTVQ